jgi:tRNA(Arg) A34 adenosine deaminase TadA
MSSRDKKYMDFVRRLATSNNMKMKLAACLVLRNEIISVGFNSDKSHPLQKRFAKNIDAIFKHAEVDCIIKALKVVEEDDLKDATLYVYRVKKQNKGDTGWVSGLAEPCPGCQKAIEHFGIKRTVFSLEEENAYGSM